MSYVKDYILFSIMLLYLEFHCTMSYDFTFCTHLYEIPNKTMLYTS